jgi:DNA-binding Lrp family transcriptional regulator
MIPTIKYCGVVLVATSPGKETEVYGALMSNNKDPFVKIKDVSPIFGEYDLIIEVETPNVDALMRYVITYVRKVSGVLETKTLGPNIGFWKNNPGLENKMVESTQ